MLCIPQSAKKGIITLRNYPCRYFSCLNNAYAPALQTANVNLHGLDIGGSVNINISYVFSTRV